MTQACRVAILLVAVAIGCSKPQAAPKESKALGTRTEIKMVTSTAKRQWLELAVQRFRLVRPDLKVMVKFAASNEEIAEILQGADQPTIFSPNDGALLLELGAKWRALHGTALLAAQGDEAPRALFRIPFVFLGSESAVRPMVAASPEGRLSWSAIQAEVKRRRAARLPPLRYGYVSFSKGSAGLNSVVMIGLEMFGSPFLTLDQANDERFARKLEDIEAAATLVAPTTGVLATRFSQAGADQLDLIFTYENTAAELVHALAERWGQPLRIYYPSWSVWSDQPAAILQGDWVAPAQHAAALVWLQFLDSRAMQLEAASMGLRPNDSALLDLTEGPLARLQNFGFRRELPPPVPDPSEAVTEALVSLSQRRGHHAKVAVH